MKASIVSSYQVNIQPAKSLHPQFPINRSKEANFKTSNPQIFPSLHPLSGFYKERNNMLPKPAFPTPKTIGLEPVKKIKRENNQCSNIVRNTLCEQVLQNIEKDEQEVAKLSIREERQSQRRNDDFEFRIPKKPSRLILEERKLAEEARKQAEALKSCSESSSVEQLLILVDNNIYSELRVPQPKRTGFVRRSADSTDYEEKQEVNFRKVSDDTLTIKTNPAPKASIQQEVLGMDNMLKTLYDNLKMEYISLQLQRNAQHLFQILQQNQDAFSKNLKTPFEMSLKEGLDLEDETDSTSDKSSDDGIKEENIKQEIHC